MRILYSTIFSLALSFSGAAYSLTLTDTEGGLPTDASCFPSPCANSTPTGISNVLTYDGTDGFISADFIWTHNYTPIVGTITSATLELDIIDADDGSLGVHQNSLAGSLIGTFDPVGYNSGGGPGPWRTPGVDALDPSLVITIASTFFSDLQDGSFTFYGDNIGMFIWGSNRAILKVDYTPSNVVPIPAALPLFGTGLALMGFFGWRRKRKMA